MSEYLRKDRDKTNTSQTDTQDDVRKFDAAVPAVTRRVQRAGDETHQSNCKRGRATERYAGDDPSTRANTFKHPHNNRAPSHRCAQHSHRPTVKFECN